MAYRMIRANGHALQTGWNQPVAEHRIVLYEKIGPGEHPCHWCGRLVIWTAGDWVENGLTADHLDFDTTHNVPENLVAACLPCNVKRNRRTRTIVLALCAFCGSVFERRPVVASGAHGHWCSRSCSKQALRERQLAGLGEREMIAAKRERQRERRRTRAAA